ncbi:type II toxin-antitoxin system VapC family toxin [Rhizobium sullae]|uniref:type II toxin-antitoxin system VapC family toxin n=1 Tax=Rhizobium sullae TaxID=50338 RepID=UPI000B350180
MIVDSSAIIAILEKERDATFYARAIREADSLVISTANAHETAVVIRGRRGPDRSQRRSTQRRPAVVSYFRFSERSRSSSAMRSARASAPASMRPAHEDAREVGRRN